jgi:hypothetical protein
MCAERIGVPGLFDEIQNPQEKRDGNQAAYHPAGDELRWADAVVETGLAQTDLQIGFGLGRNEIVYVIAYPLYGRPKDTKSDWWRIFVVAVFVRNVRGGFAENPCDQGDGQADGKRKQYAYQHKV